MTMNTTTTAIKPLGHVASFIPSCIVYCVGNTPERDASFQDFATDAGIPFKCLKGSYEGEVENSYISPAAYAEAILPLIPDEESVLLLGAPIPMKRGDRRQAELLIQETGETIPLGFFQPCSKEEALKERAWTYDPSTDQYFICGA